MKHTLIVTLVASALELMALSAAQAACVANSATPILAGPLNPVTGFPDYLTDANGLSLQRCVDTLLCSPSPVVAADPYSVQIGSGAEAPWWSATNTVFDTPGSPRLVMTFAALSTFGKTDPLTGAPVDGSQQPVLRQRLTLVAPVAGIYAVTHPYGQEIITVAPAEAGRDLVMTIDRGFAPNASVSGPVGPFLSLLSGAPAGFIGAKGQPDLVTGSPCDFNAVALTGVDADGQGIDLDGHGGNIIVSDLFDVQGQRFDGRTQTPLSATRLTYSRAAASIGQIDAFAHSTAGAVVTVQDGAATAPANARLVTPVALGHALAVTGGAENSISSALTGADTPALPPVLRLSAVDTGADPATDPTTYVQRLVDFVQISRADYDPNTQTLFVEAASGDQRVPPTLTVRGYASTPGTPIPTPAPPALVTVDSSAGGSDSALVRVITLVPPIAPSGLAVAAASSRTLRLSWADNSGNETTFDVYRGEVKLASLAPNTTTYTDTGLTPGAPYSYRVVAVNSAGANGTDVLDAATLALPATPGAPVLVANPARTVTASWADNSGDETGFQLQRATTAAGPFSAVVNTAANTASAADSTAAVASTYVYRVVALRGVDSSEASPAVAITTPGLPSAPNVPTLVAGASGTSVTLSWSDANANETGFQVQRRVGTGAFVPVGSVLAPDSTSFVDTTTSPGSSVSYRVDAINWAGSTPSAVSAALTTPNPAVLQTAGNLAASAAVSPVLTWTDTSSGETAYRVRRFLVSVAANGSITTGASNLPASGAGVSVAANSLSFTDNGKTVAPAPTKDAAYKYEVAALNGATVGPLATAYTVATAGGLPTANRPTLTRALVGTAPNQTARVTVTWTAPAPTTGIGGWEVQRCTGATCTNFVKVTGAAVNSAGTVDGRATLTFADNSVARATAYSYRLRAVGGAGTGLVGAFGPGQTVTTQ